MYNNRIYTCTKYGTCIGLNKVKFKVKLGMLYGRDDHGYWVFSRPEWAKNALSAPLWREVRPNVWECHVEQSTTAQHVQSFRAGRAHESIAFYHKEGKAKDNHANRTHATWRAKKQAERDLASVCPHERKPQVFMQKSSARFDRASWDDASTTWETSYELRNYEGFDATTNAEYVAETERKMRAERVRNKVHAEYETAKALRNYAEKGEWK